MNVFSAAVNVLFADPNMSVSAQYRSGGAGTPVEVRVIKRAPDEIDEFNAGRYVRDTFLFDVRMSEVADLNEGDTLDIDGEVFIVAGEPRRDSERLVWRAEARL